MPTDLGLIGFGSIAVDDVGQHVFVSGPLANVVDELDFSGSLVRSIPDIAEPWGMAISGRSLYVAESSAGAILRINLDDPSAPPQTVASGLFDPQWLAVAGGQLWTAEFPSASPLSGSTTEQLASIDLDTGAVSSFPLTTFSDPYLAASPGLPDTLFVAAIAGSAIYRVDVTSGVPRVVASNTVTDQENIEGLAVSPDGTRLIPAGGFQLPGSQIANDGFEELSASTLESDGTIYPGGVDPTAAAVSASGLLATSLTGYDSPNLAVYPLGSTTPMFTATDTAGESEAFEAMDHGGLAFTADGDKLFAVSGQYDLGIDTWVQEYSLAPTVTALSPATGSQLGGTTVDVSGSGFVPGSTTVSFGTTPAADVSVSSPTSLTATSPPGTGTADVTVTSLGGRSAATPADTFTYTAVPLSGWAVRGSLAFGRIGRAALPTGSAYTGTADLAGGTFSGDLTVPPLTLAVQGGLLPLKLGLRLLDAAPVSGSVSLAAPNDATIAVTARLNLSATSLSIGPLTVPLSCTTATAISLALDSTVPESALSTGLAFAGRTTIPRFKGGALCAIAGLLLSGSNDAYSLNLAPTS